ncbi:transcriptional regulator [Sphingomonas sp. HDW15A]|uniref:winged helix-turn-helix domain-containing protein n=1 Tax=Sphingomonas sp. HDW15A TaxID=2714942 RepID=UPI00140D45B9|nr:transcriptional regulator [Sphingomonas sp. HDW15A]QIK95390.1 transcriptional regulator [Sphingomonas sp. HDW15A]
MAHGGIQFEGFTLDAAQRQLRRGDQTVDLSSRYFDALALLVAEQGRLVSKNRFLDEVWRGVPVTDEALTQCIRTLRRQLGDDASRPRFIETVPKHGYRFIAPVTVNEVKQGIAIPANRDFHRLSIAGTFGGGSRA